MGGARAAVASLLLWLLLAGTAAAQSFATVDECAAYYVKTYNLTDSDAKAKCAYLFSPPPSSPIPPPSPLSYPAYSISPAEACIQTAMKEKGLSYDEAKRACLGLPPGASPSADPLLLCVERTQATKGVSYEEAKRLCAGGFPPPSLDPAMECITRLQKEKGLSYDEAKRACVFGSATSAPAVSEFEKCVALAMEVKRLSKDEAAKACAISPGPATPAAAASGFNLEGCVEKNVLGGLSKEEAAKTCASMAASQGMAAPSEPSAVNVEACVEKHVLGGVGKDEALKTCLAMAGSIPPRKVAAEVMERLKEKFHAARDALGSCLREAHGAMEQCVQSGKSPQDCRRETESKVKASCPRPDFSQVPESACVAKCRSEGEACLASRGEEVCRKEGLACLAECPEAAGKFAVTAMRMQKLQELKIAAKEAAARDESGAAVEVTDGVIQVMKRAPPPAAVPGVPAAVPGASLPPGVVLSLPMKLALGKRLASFDDSATGIALQNDELSIPMKAGAEVAAHIRAKVREAVGRGDAAEMVVERLKMETKAYEADFSDQKSKVGKVLAKLVADLKEMPEGAEVNVTPLAVLAQERQKALEETARRQGLRVKEVAYAVEVDHHNLSVEKANVTLTASKAWVESQGGPEKVRIFREADNGTKEVLNTVFQGYDGDNAVFEGRSPGLSVFSLVAVEEGAASPTPTPQPTTTPRQPGFEFVLSAVALLATALLILRRRG